MPPQILWTLTALIVSLAVVLGGSTMQGLTIDVVIQLASLPLIGIACLQLANQGIRSFTWPLVIVVGILLLPLVQLISLPPSVWSMLPGRAIFVRPFDEIGISLPWYPISLDPAATWGAWLNLMPPLAVFLAVLALNLKLLRWLTVLIIALAGFNLLVGFYQLIQGASSTGFFENRNHHVALLFSAVPLTAAWVIGLIHDRPRAWPVGVLLAFLILIGLLVGLGMARSRAGLFLGLLAILLSITLLQSGHAGKLRRQGMALVAVAGMLGGVLIWKFGLSSLSDRFDVSPLADYRFDIIPIAVETARTFQPVGSGFGTFNSVYLLNEDVNVLSQDKIDHAHNDWIELWIEGGWIAMIVLLGFLIWFASATLRAWMADRSPAPYVDRALTRAAAISVGMLLLHSLVDYPMRTTGLIILFAFYCAMLVPRCQSVPHSTLAWERSLTSSSLDGAVLRTGRRQ